MKVHTTNYHNVFIEIADDCPAVSGEVPPLNGTAKTVANMQFELLHQNPYRLTSDDVLFQVFALRSDLTKSEYPKERAEFFSKGQPCFRASPLPKRYGWGVHCNEEGKIALVSYDSPEYSKLLNDSAIKKLKAMRTSKKEKG
jgi:hypothetical protein